MIALFAAAVLASAPVGPAAPASQAPTAQASRLPPQDSGAWTASDEEISVGLVAAYARDPNRRVCATYTPTGQRIPRSVCGTLSSWFNGRTRSEVSRNRAPYILVDEVKARRVRARSQTR